MAGNSRGMMKQRVTILRPAMSIDVTNIRDPILSGYISISSNTRCYIQPNNSGVVGNMQLGFTGVDSMVGFFPQFTDIKINDVIREEANRNNGNVVRYFTVTGVYNYSYEGFHVRADLDLKNYQRDI